MGAAAPALFALKLRTSAPELQIRPLLDLWMNGAAEPTLVRVSHSRMRALPTSLLPGTHVYRVGAVLLEAQPAVDVEAHGRGLQGADPVAELTSVS